MSLTYFPNNLLLNLIFWVLFMIIGFLFIKEWMKNKNVNKSIITVIIITLIWNSANFLIRLMRPILLILSLNIFFWISLLIVAYPISFLILLLLLKNFLNKKLSESYEFLFTIVSLEFIMGFLISVGCPIIAYTLPM